MPPPHRPAPPHRPGPHHRPGDRHGTPASQVLGFVDAQRLEQVLSPLLPDAGDRRFVARCLVGEGPLHHRGANYVLLSLLARAVQAHGGVPAPAEGGVPVPMRLPPHLAEQADEGNYPLQLPLRALRELAQGDAAQLAAMIDCLTDGPPQHALANVAMVALLEAMIPATGAG